MTQANAFNSKKIRPALILIAGFWIYSLVTTQFDLGLLGRFIANFGGMLLLSIGLLVWWFRQKESPLRELRWTLPLAMLAAILLLFPLAHQSIYPMMAFFGIPLALTTAVLALLFFGNAAAKTRRNTVIAALIIGLGSFLLLRSDGLDSDGVYDLNWRWADRGEAQFAGDSTANPAPVDSSALLAASASDWPAFRGADRSGIRQEASRISTDWQANPPREIWRIPVGAGWSSMAVVKDLLFTQEQRGEQEVVVAYNRENGAAVWVHSSPVRFDEAMGGPGPRATPTYFMGNLFAQGATGLLTCLDALSGEQRWQRDVAADAGAEIPEWGYAASPLIVDSTVVVYAGGADGGKVLRYRMEDGKLIWTAATGGFSYSSPEIVTINNRRQILFLSNTGLTALNPDDGSRIWHYSWGGSGYGPMLQPRLIDQQRILVPGNPTVDLEMLKVAGGDWSATSQWQGSPMKAEFFDLVTDDGYGYGFSRRMLSCFDLQSGKRRWKGARRGPGQIVLLNQQKLLVVLTEKGEVMLVRATPEKYQELGSFQALSGKTWNHPVVADGHLFVRNGREMAAFNLHSGS